MNVAVDPGWLWIAATPVAAFPAPSRAMPTQPVVPEQLATAPFTLAQAADAGLSPTAPPECTVAPDLSRRVGARRSRRHSGEPAGGSTVGDPCLRRLV